MPVVPESLPGFGITRAVPAEIPRLRREHPVSPHSEIESDTPEVFPHDLRRGCVADIVARKTTRVQDRPS